MQKLKDGNLYWNGQLLGNIKEVGIDHLNMYGDWSIINEELYSLVKTKFDNDEEVEIIIGSGNSAIKGSILDLSVEEIEIRYVVVARQL